MSIAVEAKALFFPVVAMVAITFLAWLRLYHLRFGEMSRRKIDPQSIALSAQKDAGLSDTRGADNFNNQFQLPVLFYLACMVGILADGDAILLWLAWAFVATRLVHALIQWTYNRVVHRFAAYALGALVLWAMWARIAVGLWVHAR
jgi:hypothetical protein